MMAEQARLFNDPLNEERFGPLDYDEQRVMNALKYCYGKARAIRAPQLLVVVGWAVNRNNDRKVRAVIHRLRADHHARICSGNQGFWVPESAEEFRKFRESNLKKARSLLAAVCISFNANIEEMAGQGMLEVKK